MVFNSINFLLFFPIILIVYFLIPAKIRYIWLLIASYFFYMSWNPMYSVLIMISTLITYIGGRGLEKIKHRTAIEGRQLPTKNMGLILFAIIACNMGILVYFKYSNFLIDTINYLLVHLHMEAVPHFDILLPVGISFYTFQALGYIIDVYRGEVEAEKNLLKYALFVSFFPQLVAGPIERSKNLLFQIKDEPNHKLWDYERITIGFVTMLWGYFIKVVIADRVAVLVNYVFEHYEMLGTVELSIGAIAFALQIFCDFAGYSTIAIGAARVLGFTLMENFDTPYFAQSVAEFWRRWHISLSTWFRDYVYIPLGGNRCSKLKKYRNLLITFTVSGLWHGANWTYVVWGLLHGIYQIIERELALLVGKINLKCKTKENSFGYKFFKVMITFIAVDFAWIFFRADNLHQAWHYITRLFTYRDWWTLFDQSLYQLGLDMTEMHILTISILILFVVELLQYKRGMGIAEWLSAQWIVFRWAIIFAGIFGILIWGYYGPGYDSAQFIYFQF